MRSSKVKHLIIVLTCLAVVIGCVEEVDFQAETFESVIIIDATITNESKQQEIFISRSYRFEDDGPKPETSAAVKVSSNNSVHLFEEAEEGRYVSISEFEAIPNVEYTLEVTTQEGNVYVSTPTILTSTAQIDNVYVERGNNDDGENGMSIYIDGSGPIGDSNYYRYEYEETYKIIAPKWVPEDVIVVDEITCELLLTTRSQEERVCFKTELSTDINLANTTSLSENRVSKKLLRFINSENFILSHRYSILVRQFVISRESHKYYETLKEFSNDGSIFSQSQPGFFAGNVSSETNPSEKVVGFFDVSSVTSERIYFNYEDFYPDESIPILAYDCTPGESHQYSTNGGCGPLVTRLFLERAVYHSGASINPLGVTVGPFLVVDRRCGDCTALGSNIVPDFWVD